MNRLNWKIILSNVAEAREQLQKIERRVRRGGRLSEEELEVLIRHAYHHLNFAWNVRHVATSRYANLNDQEFRRWGRYPKEIERA